MAEKKRALGKGLSALLKDPETDITSLESNKDLINPTLANSQDLFE